MQDPKQVHITYSAEEQKRLNDIRAKYLPRQPKAPTALEKIERLDRQVENRATIPALTVGIVSLLVFGVGLTCFLVWSMPAVGIPVTLLGIAGMVAAWPLYQQLLKTGRAKAAPEILRLSEEMGPVARESEENRHE